MNKRVDLGEGFFYSFVQDGDVDPAGIIIWRLEPRQSNQVIDDEAPEGMIWAGHGICIFDLPGVRGQTKWQLLSLDPLHIEPSVQMYELKQGPDGQMVPSYHGWIRNGKWVNA